MKTIISFFESIFCADEIWRNKACAMQREIDADRTGNRQITDKWFARDAECRAADRRARVILGGNFVQSVEVEYDPIRAIYDETIPVIGV